MHTVGGLQNFRPESSSVLSYNEEMLLTYFSFNVRKNTLGPKTIFPNLIFEPSKKFIFKVTNIQIAPKAYLARHSKYILKILPIWPGIVSGFLLNWPFWGPFTTSPTWYGPLGFY